MLSQTEFHGRVLDVGGKKDNKRGAFRPPVDKVEGWEYVNIDESTHPDHLCPADEIPVADETFDMVLMTEVLEHCPDPNGVLREVCRVMKPGGFLFLTVPFIWPMHTVPHDEYRYTPFALNRMLEQAGFPNPKIEATGGRHAVLALTLGLWVRRRPLTSRVHLVTRAVLSFLLWPVIWLLLKMDRRPEHFKESTMIVGLSASNACGCLQSPM